MTVQEGLFLRDEFNYNTVRPLPIGSLINQENCAYGFPKR
jgi:hypothetical protein